MATLGTIGFAMFFWACFKASMPEKNKRFVPKNRRIEATLPAWRLESYARSLENKKGK